MTISSQTYKSGPYSTNGATTNFAYGFKIQDEDHILVTRTVTATKVAVTLTVNVDYTVTGVGNDAGGDVVISPALASGYEITVVRNVPLTQELDLSNQGAYLPENQESAYDKLTTIDQQHAEQLTRAVLYPVGETATATDTDSLFTEIAALKGTALNISEEFTAIASQTVFTLTTNTLTATSAVEMTVDGNWVRPSQVSFTVPSTVTYSGTALSGGEIVVVRSSILPSALFLTTAMIQDDAVDKDKINADVAGDGLVQAAGGELDVNVDDSSIEVATDVVQVKAAGITGAMLAPAIVDDSTIEIAANVVQAKDLGITNAKLAGSIAYAKLLASDNVVRLNTGTYTGVGTGAGTVVVTGVGFQPKKLEVYRDGIANHFCVVAGLTAGGDLDIHNSAGGAAPTGDYLTAVIMDSDGFTIKDSKGFNSININATGYTFVAYG